MGRNLYKLTKIFDDIIIMLILRRTQNATASEVEGSRGFLLNISKMVKLIFPPLYVIFRQSSIVKQLN